MGYWQQLVFVLCSVVFLTDEHKDALPKQLRFRVNAVVKVLLITPMLYPHPVTSGGHQVLKPLLPL